MENKNEAYKIKAEKQNTECYKAKLDYYKAELELKKYRATHGTPAIVYLISLLVFIILIFSIVQITEGNVGIGLGLLSTLVGTGLGLLAGKNLNDTKKSK